MHNAENAAIKQGLQSNDPSMGGEVIKQVQSLLILYSLYVLVVLRGS